MLRVHSILDALRRRWLLIFFLGSISGFAAAAAAWLFIPAPFTAFSELRISSVQEKILFKTAEERANFEVWKQTQMKLVRSPLVLNAALRRSGVAQLSTVQSLDRPSHWLDQHLLITSAGTEFIRVSLSGESPTDVTELVNAVSSAYITDVVGAEEGKRRDRFANLEKVHRTIDEELRVKRRNLKGLTDSLRSSNTAQVNDRKKFLLELAIQMRKELADVHLQLMAAGAEASVRGPEATAEVSDALVDAQISQEPGYQSQLTYVRKCEAYVAECEKNKSKATAAAARDVLARESKKLDELHEKLKPIVREQLLAQIRAKSASSNAEADGKRALLEQRKKVLEGELSTVRTEEEQTGALSFELEGLETQIAQNMVIAARVSEEIQKLRIEMTSPIGIAVYYPAEVPFQREMKKRMAGTVLGGAGAFALIGAGIILLELRSRRISSVDEVTDELHMRVVGTIPTVPRRAMKRRKVRGGSKAAYWHNVLAEAIDATRTMLLREAAINGTKSVMVSSAVSGEGKTTLSCHLATSLARAGRRTLLIDCDLRQPSVNGIFAQPLGPGFAELLCNKATLEEVIRPVSPNGLFVMSAGNLSPDVLQLLASESVSALFSRLESNFDFVLIDSSPVLPVPDALMIAQHVGGVIMSVRRDVSRLAKTSLACQKLSMLGVRVFGAVAIGLNESFINRHTYGYGYGYGGPVGRDPASPDGTPAEPKGSSGRYSSGLLAAKEPGAV